MAIDLDALEDETRPLIERTLTSLMRDMVETYEAADFVGIPPNARERVLEMLSETYRLSMRMGGEPILTDLKDCFTHLETKQTADDLFQMFIDDFIQRYGAVKVTQILETTRKQIMSAISEGQREGLSVEQIAKGLREAIPEFGRVRSRLIARTETHGSSQYAQYRTAQQSTRPLVKIWNSVEDTRTRSFIGDDRFDHRVMDEQKVAMEQPFMVPTIFGTKEPLMYCGDPAGSPANIINCRCSMTFKRANRDENLTPVVNTVARRKPDNRALLLSSIANEQPVFSKNYDNSFNGAPTLALRAIRRSTDLRGMITGKSGAFANYNGEISMGRHNMGTQSYKNVFRHEYGHILDDQMAKANPERIGKRRMFQSWDAIDDLAEDTRELEMARSGLFSGDKKASKTLIKRVQDNSDDDIATFKRIGLKAKDDGILSDPMEILRQNITDAEPDDFLKLFDLTPDELDTDLALNFAAAWERRDAYRLLQAIPRAKGKSVSHESALAGLQDTFEAGTAGKIRIQFGHGESYYKKTMRFMMDVDMTKTINRRRYNGFASAQAFANWFEAYGNGNPAAAALYRKLFPRTAARFVDMLEDYVGMAS